MKKAIRLIIMSMKTSFCLTFTMIIINAVMGIFVGLNYYSTIFVLLAIGVSIGLILMDSRKIFSKKKIRKVSKSKTVAKRNYNRTNETRRKIS